MKDIHIKDIRNTRTFPNNGYRYATANVSEDAVILTRDYFGENPLHYWIDAQHNELIIANNIYDIKKYLEQNARIFNWERVRAVHNNMQVTIDNSAFQTASPKEQEIDLPLQQYDLGQILNQTSDISNTTITSEKVRALLSNSIEQRLAAIDDDKIGILLSGGLDSMSIGYLLSRAIKTPNKKLTAKKLTAFTLKVAEDDNDIVKSRQIAQHCGIDLVEVKIKTTNDQLEIIVEKYNGARTLQYQKTIAEVTIDKAIKDSLQISGNPKKDNLFCAVAMYLIAKAIETEKISTVFCGEGPNEMINDYGYNPRLLGYSTDDKADIQLREALTFGSKTTDRQLGRGGLAKHATARMSKIFAAYNIRLEAPYFKKGIAKILTNIPHEPFTYDTIKQHFIAAMFKGENLDSFIEGTAKEKFQDGSGVSRIVAAYTQERLISLFEEIYGVRKVGYLK